MGAEGGGGVPGGSDRKIRTLKVYHYPAVIPNKEFGLAEEIQVLAKQFVTRYFGATVLTPDIVKAVFSRNLDYEYVAMIGKQRAKGPETIVWITLRRR